MRARLAWPALVVLLALGAAEPAAAFFAPGATPVSVSLERREPADGASFAVDVASDGRFVAFETAARNFFADDDPDPEGRFRRGGVFRRDLETGQLALVANGSFVQEADADGPERTVLRGAANPSVSADGRHVAFSTAERLVAADLNDEVDVYVRDMARPRDAADAFDLVSARDGTDVPATYAEPAEDNPGLDPGSDVSRGVAISDDGRRVVFRTQVPSDLPQAAGTTTPPFQVLVRDRSTNETRLVTRLADPADATRPRVPPSPVELVADGPATISADGTTVAWSGTNAPVQTRFQPGEGDDPTPYYYLWQRVADAPAGALRTSATTRRVTGFTDPDDPGCAPGTPVSDSPSATGPCLGPLTFQESNISSVAPFPPALSADGRRVAFITGVSPRPSQQFPAPDLFVADMSAGVTRKAGTTELTRDTVLGGTATSGSVEAVTLSPDGRWALVATRRTRFVLPALRLVSPERTTPGVRELYLVDLEQRTVERVLRTLADGDLDADVGTGLSLSRDARRLAFTSSAATLFRGDANEQPDAFVATRTDAPPAEPPLPPEPEPEPVFLPEPDEPEARARRLPVFVRRAPRGQVRLLVRAPVRGDLDVRIRGRLPDRAGRQRGRLRTFADRSRSVRKKGAVVVTLGLAKRFRGRLRAAGTLRAQAILTLVARSDGTEYQRRIAVGYTAPAGRARKRGRR